MRTTSIDALQLRRVLDRRAWQPPEPFGPDGWRLVAFDRLASVIVTQADFDDTEWRHASIARHVMPSYEDLVLLQNAAWPDGGYAYQVFAPAERHVNIHEHALHLWGRADGANVLPDFAFAGSI